MEFPMEGTKNILNKIKTVIIFVLEVLSTVGQVLSIICGAGLMIIIALSIASVGIPSEAIVLFISGICFAAAIGIQLLADIILNLLDK